MPEFDVARIHRKLIEHMAEAVWIGDENERTVYANPKFCELMEYSLEEMIGRESYDFWDRESAERVRKVNLTHRKNGISSSYEGDLLTKSGKKIPVLLRGTPLPDGGTIGIMTDLRELRKKESTYKKLVEHMNEAVWMGDENERTIYANPKFCELMEYTLEEMIGRESYDFWDKESADRVKNVNLTHRQEGISSSYEGNLLTKSGKKIPVLLSGTPLPDGGTIGIMTDLRELRQKEIQYKRLVEHMNEIVWMGDKDERTLYVNPKFCETMGYSFEEMMGKEFFDFWTEESIETIKHHAVTKRQKGLSSSYEAVAVTKDGHHVQMLISGAPLDDGGTIGIMTDLRELKAKEKKEMILNKAIKYANDAIITFDQDGKVESWNKGAKLMFGYKKAEIVGASLDKLFAKTDVAKILDSSDVLYNFEFKGKHKNDNEITISATLTPVYDEEKKEILYFYLLIARDITHQAKFEEELALKYKKMREAYNKFGVMRRQMDYMVELMELAENQGDRKVVSDFIVSSIIMLTKVDACVLRLFNEKKDQLELMSCFGLGDDWKGKAAVKYENSLAKKAFELGAPLKIIDLSKEPKYMSKHLANKNSLCSLLLIPLQFQGKLVGSLSLYASAERKLEIFENEFIEKYAKVIQMVVASV